MAPRTNVLGRFVDWAGRTATSYRRRRFALSVSQLPAYLQKDMGYRTDEIWRSLR